MISTALPPKQQTAASFPRVDRVKQRLSWIALSSAGLGVLLFLFLPVLVVVPMSFSSASTLQFPPEGFSLRWYAKVFSDPEWVQAIVNSLVLALVSSTLALVLGTLGSYALIRGSLKFRSIIHSNFIAPIIIPPVVFAVGLYFLLSWAGMLGTFLGMLVAHTILSVPFVVMIMSVAIADFDVRIEQVALTLGASWTSMFLRVLMPNLLPSVAAAWIFAFVTSFDEVTVTNFIAGTYQTVPKKMFGDLTDKIDPTITAIATVLIAVSLGLLSLQAMLKARAGKSNLPQ